MKQLLTSLLIFSFITSFSQNTITGFSPQNTTKELELEKAFEAKLNATNLDQWMQKMSAEPHWVGTKFGEENAKWIQDQFKSWGYDTKI